MSAPDRLGHRSHPDAFLLGAARLGVAAAVGLYVATFKTQIESPGPSYARPAALAVAGLIGLIGAVQLHPRLRASRGVALSALAVDNAAALALAALYSFDESRYLAVLPLLAVFEAGAVLGVRGALAAWAVAVGGYATVETAAGQVHAIHGDPEGVALWAGVGLVLAVGAGSFSARRKADEDLRRETDLYETLLQAQSQLGEGVAYVEGERFTFVNDAFCEITGYGREELLNIPSILVILSPDQKESVAARIRRRESAGQGSDHYETVIVTKGGDRVDLGVAVHTLQLGIPSRRVVIVRDITQRRRAEEGIARLNRRLQTLLEIDKGILGASSPAAIAEAALEGMGELVTSRLSSVTVFDHDAGEATLLAVEADGETSLRTGARIPLEDVESGDGLRRGEAAVAEDLRAFSDTSPFTRTLLAEGVRSCMRAPLIADGDLLGSLNLGADEPGSFTPEQIDIALGVADQLAVALQQAGLREQLRQRASELEVLVSDLRNTDTQRRALLSRLVHAEEAERARIAADVHDDPIQKITAVGMRLELVRRSVGDPEQLKLLGELRGSIDLSITSLRNLLFELRPPALDRDGIGAAIRQNLDRVAEEEGFAFHVEERIVDQPPSEIRSIIYRIAQEALANVRRHARAKHVSVLLEQRERGIFARVRDDGVGFSRGDDGELPGHLGLPSMRERAEMAGGWFKVRSEPGLGTTVEFWLPNG